MNTSKAGDDQRDERETQPPPASDVQTRFAWLRTRMALQTTLAAWVRTATSLIGFGFAIVQFLERVGPLASSGAPRSVHLSRMIGLVLISAGALTTAVAMWEYRVAVKYLESDGFRDVAGVPTFRHEPPDVAVWMAVLVCVIGVLAFGLILTSTQLR